MARKGMSKEEEEEEEEEEGDDESDKLCEDEEDDGQTDVSDDDIDEDEEDQCDDCAFQPGAVVWVKHGCNWFPAQIKTMAEVPNNLTQRFAGQRDKLIVKWVGEENYNMKHLHHIQKLGENLSDAALASKSKYIMQQYNIALGMRLSYNS